MKNNEIIHSITAAREMERHEIETLQFQRLTKLVQYAKQYSPLYAQLFKSLPDAFTLKDLPVSYKKNLVENMDDWFTDKAVNSASIQQYLIENEDPTVPFLDKYSILTTSGTTGKPLVMVRDAYHNLVHNTLISTRLLQGLDTQILNPAKHRIASVIFTRGNVSSYSSFKKMAKANEAYADNIMALSIMDPIQDIVKELNHFRPEVLTGYPSMMTELAKEQANGNLNIHPLMIACSAETLTESNFHILKDTFKCPILNNYCSTEGGEIAMSCSEGILHINSDWVIVEPIDREGKPVADGELSDAVLITDLSNYIQPIIRYQVDDCVRIEHSECRCGNPFPKIEIQGRKPETILFGDKEFQAVLLSATMHDIDGVLNYQFIQTSPKSLQFRGVIPQQFNPEEVKRNLYQAVSSLLIKNKLADIDFTFSDEPIIKNSAGGKSKPFILLPEFNKMSQSK